MSSPAAPPPLARWDDPLTVWDGPAPFAFDITLYPSIRLALIWEGHILPAPPPTPAAALDRWPATAIPVKDLS